MESYLSIAVAGKQISPSHSALSASPLDYTSVVRRPPTAAPQTARSHYIFGRRGERMKEGLYLGNVSSLFVANKELDFCKVSESQ
jgi:hypothetical protein